jgi:hypothetical protein
MADIDWQDVPIEVATTPYPFSTLTGVWASNVGSDVVFLYGQEPYVAYTRDTDPLTYTAISTPPLDIHGQPGVEAGVIGSVVIPVTNTILVYFGAQFWG